MITTSINNSKISTASLTIKDGIIDRRQFIIMDTPYMRMDFNNISLSNGMVLSFQRDLTVRKEAETLLLGLAFDCRKIGEIDLTKDIKKEKRYWCGRWVLVNSEYVYMDCCGSLGLYYAIDKDNRVYLSSSIALLSDAIQANWKANYQIKYGDGHASLDFYPIPETVYDGIHKLLPTQYFDFSQKQPRFRDDYLDFSFLGMQIDEMICHAKATIETVLLNIHREYGDEVWLTLTGGVDSRTNFAAAVSSGIPFRTFTLSRSNTKDWDISRPQKISKTYGIEHLLIPVPEIKDAGREEVFDQHTSGQRRKGRLIVGTERQQFVSNIDVPVRKKAIVIWGTIWEVYNRNWWKVLDDCEGKEERIGSLKEEFGEIVYSSNVHEESLKSWLQYVDENPMHSMDWRKRFYYEQRVGAWVSGAQQAFDLFDSERIALANCQEIIEVFMSLIEKTFPKGERGDKRYQLMLIEKCAPKLKRMKCSEETNISTRLRNRLSRFIHRRKKNRDT